MKLFIDGGETTHRYNVIEFAHFDNVYDNSMSFDIIDVIGTRHRFHLCPNAVKPSSIVKHFYKHKKYRLYHTYIESYNTFGKADD